MAGQRRTRRRGRTKRCNKFGECAPRGVLEIPGGDAPSTVTLLGCDVPQSFALKLQDELYSEFGQLVRVKTLPFAEEGTLLARNLDIGNTWDYWKKIPDINEFQRLRPDFEDRLYRTAIDPRKPYLSEKMSVQEMMGLSPADEMRLKANTNFYVKMFDTTTSANLPNHAVFVS